jgi:putative DNA primase/helicase
MKNPLLTLGLAIQPKVLEDLGHGSKRIFRGNGLLSRFLYYQCETHRGQRFYANQQQVSPEIRNRYVSGINRLLDIPLACDEFGNPAPTRLYLDRESKKLWVDFSDEIERKLVPGGEFDSVSDWAGKLAGNTLRVAGLFHVVEHGMASRAINSETVDRAIKLMKVLIPHAKSALNATANSGLANDAEHVCSWIVDNEHRSFTKRNCHRALSSKFNTVKELEPVIAELIARNIVRRVPNIKGMGRPSDMIQSNPAIFV